MTLNDMVKEEPGGDAPCLLFDNASVGSTINLAPGSPGPAGNGVETVGLEPQPAGSDTSALQAHTSPAPALNSLANLEMKPIFVPSPWPTYLTLPQQSYSNFVSARDINYTPQAALEQAFLMLKSIEGCIQQLNMHTELRRIMWRKKIAALKTYNHGYITIAICGGTGAGKSSLINAVLDAQILPTSDSRACTSAVVEVRYHRHPFFSAEIEFFTHDEWRAELGRIFDDVHSKLNPDGDPEFDSEFVAHVKVAWQKATQASAVYPSLTHETLGVESPEEIIKSNPETACLLGTTKMLEAGNPSEFRSAIASYMTAGGGNSQIPNAPQLWPLVKKVQVYTKSAALESGSRLVDLPGTGDVNEARNKVAKSYLSEADYVWIVAPIKRAADESAANGTDNVTEREIIESLGLGQDPCLLELQAEITGINEALKRLEREGGNTPAARLEISVLKEKRVELKKLKKRTLARKRNEGTKRDLQQKFRTGLIEIEPNPGQDNSGAQTSLSTIDSDLDVPVFTCSSYDYTGINLEDDYEPICFNQVEDTEIPRLQNFCYDLALPAQREPILRLFQNLEKFLCRLREYAGADNGLSYADRFTLANKWESDTSSVTEHSFLSILNGSSGTGSRTASQPPDSSDEIPKPTLESVTEQATKLSAEKSSSRGFSYEARQAMETVIQNCVKHLKQELRGALEDILLKGAAEAEARALGTHDLFAPRVVHWATYRATLRRHGEYKRNLNQELLAPITQQLLATWPKTFEKPLLAPMVRDAKLWFEIVLSRVKLSSPPALLVRCDRQCQSALQEAESAIHEIERSLKKLIVRKQRRLSRSLAPSIKGALGAAYREAIEIRGPKSTGRQKTVFRDHVDTLRGTMFTESITSLMEELDSMAESIGAEVNLATLWHTHKLSKEEIEKRKEFIREADSELRQ
ncbi:hypothetical protein FRC11_007412, partial [Ceratobasidium sp. 423]